MLAETKERTEALDEHLKEGGKRMLCGHPEQAACAGDDGVGFCRWCRDLQSQEDPLLQAVRRVRRAHDEAITRTYSNKEVSMAYAPCQIRIYIDLIHDISPGVDVSMGRRDRSGYQMKNVTIHDAIKTALEMLTEEAERLEAFGKRKEET